jgi:hypothetical protein
MVKQTPGEKRQHLEEESKESSPSDMEHEIGLESQL